MFNRLNRLLGRRVTEVIVEPTPAELTRISPNPGTRVLIVDDSKTLRAAMDKALWKQGYECFSAYDGQSGLDVARECRPALIIMDVVMPGLNGFQALRLLRHDSDSDLAQTPVIMMSGDQQAAAQFWSTRIGANDFMIKPFSNDELFASIEKCLFPAAKNDIAAPSHAEQPSTIRAAAL